MRGVNLSRRPFVNRRPVLRVVVILWVLAGLLVLANLRLFTGYLAESHDIRGKVAEADQALRGELAGLGQLDGQIARISLGEQNRQALFLNSLISYRTFPWSALFDDLEKVIPPQVRLLSIRPVLRLASEEALSRAEQQAREEARQRSRRRRGRGDEATAARDELGREESPGRNAEDPLASDEVRLELNCVAADEDSLITFLETLYDHSNFRRPLLRNESYSGRQVSFSMVVLYRTGKRFDLSSEEDETMADDAAQGDTPPVSQVADTANAPATGNDGATVAPTVAPTDGGAVPGGAVTPPSSPAPEPAPPAPPKRGEDERRARQVDEEVAAARRAVSQRANAEERQQNEAENRPETLVDQRRQRLEELRRRARERRENQGAQGGRSSALVLTPGTQPARPPGGGANNGGTGRPTGTDGGRRPPPRGETTGDDPPPPAGPDNSASGTPRIGGMAALFNSERTIRPREVRA